MKKILLGVALFFIRLLWRLRYKVTFKGLDEVKEKLKSDPHGVLFLPNHPAIFIDPLVITVPLLQSFEVRPLIVEYMYYHPLVHWAATTIKALPIPNFHTGFNPIKQRRSESMIRKMSEGLKKGERFLMYPSGTTKQGPKEILGGAFATHQLLHENPNATVVLVRLTGLWGSMFSRALTHGQVPDMNKALKKAFWIVLKNLIFFTPRRKITVEFELAPADFPKEASKPDLNHYLEEWYNKPFHSPDGGKNQGEPLTLVSYSMWKEELPQVTRASEDKLEMTTSVPERVKDQVISKVALLAKKPKEEIRAQDQLIADLGFDSLDLSEIVSFLEERFDVSGIQPGELTTVSRLFLIAMKVYKKPEVEETEWNLKAWKKMKKESQRIEIPDGETIPEVFLRKCDEQLFDVAAADLKSGVVTYRNIKMKALLLSEKIRNLPGDRVGVMLPASVGVEVVILACQLAGKTPVMINWTVGGRHLDTVVEVSKIQKVITSWAFLDNLENVDISRIEEMLIVLEEMRAEISLIDIAKAEIASLFSSHRLLKQPRFKHLTEDGGRKEAVILFTSGTEAMPKGVPLTHKNILSNIRSLLGAVELQSSDKLLAMLPPFHSFGFVVTGLMPLLGGLRVVFFPNPTESKRLAKATGRWGITLLASAPTFLKNILLAAEKEHLSSLRLLVSGAEKAPQELFDLSLKMNPHAKVTEGYGITECSPVLTFNSEG
ncbi:MAG TPA: AMP-binding protein, partial [Chlamydiales bacterium]|nr:AMP-binding protein [Chlamydiales bacterium]